MPIILAFSFFSLIASSKIFLLNPVKAWTSGRVNNNFSDKEIFDCFSVNKDNFSIELVSFVNCEITGLIIVSNILGKLLVSLGKFNGSFFSSLTVGLWTSRSNFSLSYDWKLLKGEEL